MQDSTLIIFGATGDLTQDKLFPALYQLETSNHLGKDFSIVAVARTEFSLATFKRGVKQDLKRHCKAIDDAVVTRLLDRVSYLSADLYNAESYVSIEEEVRRVEGNGQRIYYLALPTQLFSSVISHLGSCNDTAKVCRSSNRRTKVILEKPFGSDYKTAKELHRQVRSLFKEEQIYRIDHFLGKESFQNIYAFRFANQLIDASWDRSLISAIKVTAREQGTAAGRASYYDKAGAIRDMVQNHLIQLIAASLMDQPASFTAQDMQKARANVIKTLRPFGGSVEMLRGQYVGYLSEDGVERGSRTETYVATILESKSRRWKGVPILVETGKGLQAKETSIEFFFKSKNSLYTEAAPNSVKIELSPCMQIRMRMNMEKPDFQFSTEPQNLTYEHLNHCPTVRVGDYERLLLDVLKGEQSLFVSGTEVLESWKVVDPLIESAKRDRLRKYALKSDGPNIKQLYDRLY